MVRDDIRQTIANALLAAQAAGRLPAFELPGIEIARPKQAEHGDYSSNVAMVVAAAIRKVGRRNGRRGRAATRDRPGDCRPHCSRRPGRGRRGGRSRLYQHPPGRCLAAAAGGGDRRWPGPPSATSIAGRGQRWQVEYRQRQSDRPDPLWRRTQRRAGRRHGQRAGRRPATQCSASSMSTTPAPSSSSLPPRFMLAICSCLAATSRCLPTATRANT